MKKILLGTTALFGAVALASAAQAQGPNLTVGGFIDFQAGFQNEDLDAGFRNYGFQNDTEVHVKVDGKSDNGLGYGAVIELEADVSADADGEGVNADKTYIYLSGGWGRFELGSNVGPTKTMKVDASTFARATGGIDGDWYDFIHTAGVGLTQLGYLVSPDLPSDFGRATFGDSEDATKINYYSPVFSGFQLGLSFTPDTGDVGQVPQSGDVNFAQAENVFGLGLSYTGKFQQIGVKLSATGEIGESESALQEDLGAYALGASFSYLGFTFGGSWGDWGDSYQAVNSNNDADFWNLGLAYDFGPFGASIGYIDSENAGNESQNLVIGADYKLAPGLVPYAEVSFFELDSAGTANDNDGTVFLVGTQLNF